MNKPLLRILIIALIVLIPLSYYIITAISGPGSICESVNFIKEFSDAKKVNFSEDQNINEDVSFRLRPKPVISSLKSLFSADPEFLVNLRANIHKSLEDVDDFAVYCSYNARELTGKRIDFNLSIPEKQSKYEFSISVSKENTLSFAELGKAGEKIAEMKYPLSREPRSVLFLVMFNDYILVLDKNDILLQIKDQDFKGKKVFSLKNSLSDPGESEIFVKSVRLEKTFSKSLSFIYLNQNPLEVPEHIIKAADESWNKLNIENTANEGKGLSRYIRRVMLGNETMESIFLPFNASLAYEVEIPRDAYLGYSVALHAPDNTGLSGSVFEVTVTNGEKTESFITALDENPGTLRQNFRHKIENLQAFAGENVDIIFQVRDGGNGTPADESYIILGAPNLYVRENATKQKNVILISLDTLSAGHLGCYGYRRDTSPNIDKFAAESALFMNPIASSCWTLPSHMSMMTGLHPTETGFFLTKTPHNNVRFSSSIRILAEYIKAEGYRTVAFTGGALVGSLFGYDRGFDTYYQKTSSEDKDAKEEVDRAIKWIRDNDSNFFMFFHTYEVHFPYMRDYYNQKESKNIKTNRDRVIAKYDSGIRYADEQIGRLIEALKDKRIYSNTLIIITSDHGESFRFITPDSLSGDHGISLYDDEIKVPLIIGGAKEFARGQTIRSQVRSIDIMPTILDYLGIELEHEIRGASLMPLLGEADSKERIAFAEATWKAPCESKALRTDSIKYIQNMYEGAEPKFGKVKHELYDLEMDPGEAHRDFDKYGREIAKYRQIMNSMLKSIAKNAEKLEYLIQTNQNQDSELLKQLLGLGYLN